jgi:two-component system, LytTR family, response regulator
MAQGTVSCRGRSANDTVFPRAFLLQHRIAPPVASWPLLQLECLRISGRMEVSSPPVAPRTSRRLSDRQFDALAAALAFLSYFLVFLAVRSDRSAADAAISSLINLLPLLVLAVAARAILKRYVIGSTPLHQIAAHVTLGAGFSLLWYWLLMISIGVRAGESFTEFVVQAFFPDPVFAWQLLQGLTVYALIAALTYLRTQPELPSFVIPAALETEAREPSLSRYFMRRGDDIYPVDVAQIISIKGADDYAEVATLEGSHLVRTTLAEFEASLDQSKFVRVHRSHLVNLDWIARAEPSGSGRLLLHMQNGVIIPTSRSGAKMLRDRMM